MGTREFKCDICLKNVEDSIEYGEILTKSNISVHYYCLLLSTHLDQNGKDTGGILGFLISDIKKEIENARLRYCFYCNESNASIKCYLCDRYFHSKCGLEQNCLFQFVDEFKSFCHEHHYINHQQPHIPTAGCFICRKKMGTYNPLTSITSNCCEVGAWVHRKCLKKFALAAGYYFKCLWCTSNEFRNYARLHGIFVPDRDASWEALKGAYSELYIKIKNKCMALKCLCPQGRNYKTSNKWIIEACILCGGTAIHKLCRSDNSNINTDFVCKTCDEINEKKLSISKFLGTTYNIDAEFDTTLFMPKSQRLLSYSYENFDLPGINNEIPNKTKPITEIEEKKQDDNEIPNKTKPITEIKEKKQDDNEIPNKTKPITEIKEKKQDDNEIPNKTKPITEIKEKKQDDTLLIYNGDTLDIVGFTKSCNVSDINNIKNYEIEDLIPVPQDTFNADEFLRKINEYVEKGEKANLDTSTIQYLSEIEKEICASGTSKTKITKNKRKKNKN